MTNKTRSLPPAAEASWERAPKAHAARGSAVLDPRAHSTELVYGAAGNLAIQELFRAGAIHAKLSISQPSDPDEEEADRMADQVMSSPGNAAVHRKCDACGSAACAGCEEEEGAIHRKAESDGVSGPTRAIQSQIEGARAGGEPLRDSLRAFFEPRFGQDLSRVRVHSDARAAESAKAIHARAFTIGHDVVFGARAFAPESHDGRRLLAHELAHVVQHKGSSGRVARDEKKPEPRPDAAPPSAQLPAGVLSGGGPIARKPPATGAETIIFEGVLLSQDAEFDRWQLEQTIAGSGDVNTQGFIERLAKSPEEDQKRLDASRKLDEDLKKYGPGDVSGAPLDARTVKETEDRILNKERTKKTIETVKAAYEKLAAENRDLVQKYETTASGDLLAMLRESKTRVMGEAGHYGIPGDVFRSTIRLQAFPQPKTPVDVKQQGDKQNWEDENARRTEAAAQAPRAKLIEAAKALQKKREEVEKLRAHSDKATPGQRFPTPKTAIDVLPLVKAEGEYKQLRRDKEAEFPILAKWAQEGGDLTTLIKAGGSGGDLKKAITDELLDKYNKIQATEDYIADKKVTFWDIPIIVEGARAKLRIDKGTMQWRVIDDHINGAQKAKQEAEETKAAILGVATAIALLASVPSAGAAGAAFGAALGAAISVEGVVSGIQAYMIQSATSGSDFDKARSISQEEPSLMWVALDVVSAVFDLHGAMVAFKSLAGLRRAALLGEKQAAEAMVRQGDEFGKQLGRRMANDVTALQKSGKATASVAHAAGQVVDREALQAAKLGEAAVHGVEVHEIIVTKAGAFRCSQKCGNLMWLYEDVFELYPSLRKSTQDAIQRIAEKEAKAAESLAALTQRMDRLREIALMSEDKLKAAIKLNPAGSPLADQLLFEQYRRGGGAAAYEEWYVRSKGAVAKGGEVWGELSEELKLAAESGKKGHLTAAQQKQLVAEAIASDTAESIKGNYRVKFASLHADFPGGREWQVHHSIPQKFRATLTKAGVSVDSPSFLRGVRSTPGAQSNLHAKITTNWQDWHKDFFGTFGREPSAAEIIERAKQVDWTFGGLYWEAEKAAGIPVPLKP